MGGGRPRDQSVDLRFVDPRILQRSLESNCRVTEEIVWFLLGPHRCVVLDPIAVSDPGDEIGEKRPQPRG